MYICVYISSIYFVILDASGLHLVDGFPFIDMCGIFVSASAYSMLVLALLHCIVVFAFDQRWEVFLG